MKIILDGQDRFCLADCRFGRFLYDTRDALGRELFIYGERAVPEIELLTRLVAPGDTVIDLGANIGTETVPMAKAVGPSGRVLSFEPQRSFFHMLCANLVLNGLDNVLPFNLAVGDESACLDFRQPEYREEGNYSGLSLVRTSRFAGEPVAGFDSRHPDRIGMVRLDDFLDLERCALIKMDIEGMEESALRGARDLVTRTRPILYCEMNDPGVGDSLIAAIRNLGYNLYWHAFSALNPHNHHGRPIDPSFKNGDVNALCVPVERELHVEGHPIREFREVYTLFPGILGIVPPGGI